MARRYLPFHEPPKQPPQMDTAPWWRPLTNRWGIGALIIFIGLVIGLFDRAARWQVPPPPSSIELPHTDHSPARYEPNHGKMP